MNAFFVYTLTLSLGYSWQESLSILLVSSILFLIVSITGIRTKIVNAIPQDLKFAISVLSWFVYCLFGLGLGGVVISDSAGIRLGSFR